MPRKENQGIVFIECIKRKLIDLLQGSESSLAASCCFHQ